MYANIPLVFCIFWYCIFL